MPFKLKPTNQATPAPLYTRFILSLGAAGKVVFKNCVPSVKEYPDYFDKITNDEYNKIIKHTDGKN